MFSITDCFYNHLCPGTRLVFNAIILVSALRRLPEFAGYRARRFPGQPPPALPRIAPRRLQLPPSFAQDEVSCDWWRAGHVTPELPSDWSSCGAQGRAGHQ